MRRFACDTVRAYAANGFGNDVNLEKKAQITRITVDNRFLCKTRSDAELGMSLVTHLMVGGGTLLNQRLRCDVQQGHSHFTLNQIEIYLDHFKVA